MERYQRSPPRSLPPQLITQYLDIPFLSGTKLKFYVVYQKYSARGHDIELEDYQIEIV